MHNFFKCVQNQNCVQLLKISTGSTTTATKFFHFCCLSNLLSVCPSGKFTFGPEEPFCCWKGGGGRGALTEKVVYNVNNYYEMLKIFIEPLKTPLTLF